MRETPLHAARDSVFSLAARYFRGTLFINRAASPSSHKPFGKLGEKAKSAVFAFSSYFNGNKCASQNRNFDEAPPICASSASAGECGAQKTGFPKSIEELFGKRRSRRQTAARAANGCPRANGGERRRAAAETAETAKKAAELGAASRARARTARGQTYTFSPALTSRAVRPCGGHTQKGEGR